MACGRGRGSTLPGRTSSGRGSKASGMPDPGRGLGVDETPTADRGGCECTTAAASAD